MGERVRRGHRPLLAQLMVMVGWPGWLAGWRTDGRGGRETHLVGIAEGTELRHVNLDRLQVAQVRPRAEKGGGGDDERREL